MLASLPPLAAEVTELPELAFSSAYPPAAAAALAADLVDLRLPPTSRKGARLGKSGDSGKRW
jgi:hypothetical protein